jgi:predicted HTH domain antitoxin
VPRRRKGPEYLPEIPVLLRDAQELTVAELAEPDARKRRERERDRDLAIAHLRKICRDAKKLRQLSQLDRASVRIFSELLKDRNRGQLPKAKGGRPTGEHKRLLIAVHVHEVKKAIEGTGTKRGSLKAALYEVAKRDGVSHDHVSDIYKDRDPDFRRDVAVELDLRRRKIHGKG